MRVGLRPEADAELPEIEGALAVGQGELEEAILRLGPKYDELGQAINVKVLAHVQSGLLAAIYAGNQIIVLALAIVELSSQSVHLWR